jgi:hypothetical protein
MRSKNWTRGVAGVALLLFLTLCLLPIGGASTATKPDTAAEISEASAPAGAPVATVSANAPAASPPAASQATAAPAVPRTRPATPAPSNVAIEDQAPVADETADETAAVEEDDSNVDAPRAAAWTSQAPANFKVTYTVSNHTATSTWDKVTSPTPHDYRVYKWDSVDYPTISSIYQKLTAIDPSVLSYYNDWKATMDAMIANTPGYTNAERQNALHTIQGDADVLNGVLCNNIAADSLLTQFKGLATKKSTSGTSWADTSIKNNYYYMYAVLTRNSSHVETSPFSHTDYTFTVRNNSTVPAAPTGVKATAYDPGVVVEWSRNQEYDLAGYNVYKITGTTWTKLNSSLITTGTEYYYAGGTAGQVFGVTATDTSSPVRESAKTAKATAVLAPATTYTAIDPGWVSSGTWKIENYTADGGGEILVGNDTGSQTSHAFSGRRVKIAVATYWSCGIARILIDGVDYGTVNLNSAAMAWNVSIFTASGLAKGNHTLTIEITGAGGQGDLHFVNVQSIEVR